ncbi:MAG TPA: PSD1 and planctomycete cytochrome C domain-containing protein [Pirellulales bacterium]|nr:PSD1 and planctomycete cytochrome C domain-containing protein [Pirellulales bacterium]
MKPTSGAHDLGEKWKTISPGGKSMRNRNRVPSRPVWKSGARSLVAGVVFFSQTMLPNDAASTQDPQASAASAQDIAQFEKKVRPLLLARCVKCHGAEKSEAGLRLDSAAALAAGGDSGPVVVAGKPDDSPLIQAVRQTAELKMPPDGKLDEIEVAELVAWVAAGAAWPADVHGQQANATAATPVKFTAEQKAFWAFQPVHDPPPPDVKATGWPTSPIDCFILAPLERQGLSPAPPADKRTLLRRVSFDLIGLPPTPEEIDAFLADPSPDALAKVVDRLLRSPHYGERWGRHWLDVVRYAESTANDANAVMRYAFRYRDYVVDAFNRDLPYDQFIIEQLAGDLLPGTTDINEAVRRVIATGYLLLGPKALSETDKEQSRLDIVDDQIDVTGRAFLGLTLACARCHDHKFDPLPTIDYYALAGIFRGTEPFMDEVRTATMWWEFPLFQAPGDEPFMVMAPKEGKPVDLRVHLRGNRFNLGRVAPRRFLQIIAGEDHPPPAMTGSGRLELARWIASPQNPLTARVMVNRVWQHHFGRGLVASSDNFGRRGEPPSHPELLDWLAARFIESGWSVKALHKRLLLSSTYQMAGASNTPAEQVDPDNRLLWRMPRRRLEAEILRDAILAAGGKLDAKVGGGESSEFLWSKAELLGGAKIRPNTLKADDPYYSTSLRRSLYLPVVRNLLPDVLALFDAADPNGVTAVRNDTTVPAQSLFMLNNPVVRERALDFARLLLTDGKLDESGRIALAYARALGRPPEAEELAEAIAYLRDYAGRAAAPGKSEAEVNLAALQSYCQLLFCSNEFMYVD